MSLIENYPNYMTSHQDGLDKHIHVTTDKRFTEAEVVELYTIGCIPLYIRLPDQLPLAVVLGGDLVLDSLDDSGDGNGSTELQPVPTVQKVSEALNTLGLSYYLDQIYTRLNLKRDTLELMLIGRSH